MSKKFISLTNVAFLLVMSITFNSSSLWADTPAPYNQAILDIIKDMPEGGGYSTSSAAFKLLKASMGIHNNELEVNPEKAVPSFCSSATYLVFLKLITQLQKENKLDLTLGTQRALLVKGEPDGSGVWGRWNANGPGTGRLFYQLQLGRNFTSDKLSQALPGDFMKIFWTDEIGSKERGHSVIFTGTYRSSQGRVICYWSSNQPAGGQSGGMGEKCVPQKKIRRALFSRLEYPEKLNDVERKMPAGSPSFSDTYLKNLLIKPSTPQEMCKKVGCS